MDVKNQIVEVHAPQHACRSGAKRLSDGSPVNIGPAQCRHRALVCAPLMPEFDRESGSGRIYDFILFLRDAGWKVTFVSRNSIGRPDRYVRLLEEAHVVARAACGDDIGELYAPPLRALIPHAKVIVDSVDLHFLRNARQTFVQPVDGARPSLLEASAGCEIIRELNTYAAADAVLTVSEKEAALLNALLGDQANATPVPDCEDLPLSSRPFGARKGLLFVGNFRHAPNVDAIKYLCREVLPRLPAAILDAHPLYVVGNDVNDDVRTAVAGLPYVRLVGWVPSLIPYFEQARVALVPLRYGAGTKRKLVQSLMIGTPAVSSTVGTEGLDLRDGEQVLVADDASRFAAAMVLLLQDEALWQRLASNGRTHVMARHGRELARQTFLTAVERVLTTDRKRPQLPDPRIDKRRRQAKSQYGELVERIRVAVDSTVPQHACVLVISKGDDALLELGSRRGWHFPQTNGGRYAGHYPLDSAAAIAQLQALHEKGAQYLLLPSIALWWLEYYEAFRQHLEQHYRLVYDRNDTCLIFALNEAGADLRDADKQCRHIAEPPALPTPGVMIAPVEAKKAAELEDRRGARMCPQLGDGGMNTMATTLNRSRRTRATTV